MSEAVTGAAASPTCSSNAKVAIVHDWLTGMRGGEKVLEQIARLYPRAPIYTLFHFPGSVSSELETHPIHTSFVQRFPMLKRRYRHYLPLFPRAIESFDLSGYDLILSTSHCVAKSVHFRSDAQHLCYCHTPMRYVWDQQRVYFPKSSNPVALVRDGLLSRLRRWDQRTAHRPTRYLANSSFVRKRIETYYQRDSDVVAPPVDVDFFKPAEMAAGASHPSARTHLLCVAALNAYKKVGLAIEAAARLKLPLVVVGQGPDKDALARRAHALGSSQITFRHGISADELRELYRNAIAFVQPGIEDFGIAAAESLACGTPVVAAAEGGVLDIVESGTEGILYPPSDQPDELTEAIRQVQTLDFDSVAASQRAQRFSEQAFVERLKRSIDAVATT